MNDGKLPRRVHEHPSRWAAFRFELPADLRLRLNPRELGDVIFGCS